MRWTGEKRLFAASLNFHHKSPINGQTNLPRPHCKLAAMELAREELLLKQGKRRYAPEDFARTPKPENLMERRKVADVAR